MDKHQADNWVAEAVLLKLSTHTQLTLSDQSVALFVERCNLPNFVNHPADEHIIVCRLIYNNLGRVVPSAGPDRCIVLAYDPEIDQSVAYYCGKEYSYNMVHPLCIDKVDNYVRWMLAYLNKGRFPEDAPTKNYKTTLVH